MRKALTALLTIGIITINITLFSLSIPTSAASCDDVKIIFARGSGQELGEEESYTFRGNISKNIKLALPNLKYSFYELGSEPQDGYQYPAIDLNFISAISTTISGGSAFEFGESVSQGINELKSYIKNISSNCPSTKFVLGGYSQGAMVMTKAMPDLNPNKVVYVANFGDPKLYLPEGEGLDPDACRGVNLSPYREYVPNCRTSAGYLGAKKPYLNSGWTGKAGLWCNDGDFICGAGFIAEEPFRTHVKYASDGHIKNAATIIGKKLIDTYPNYLATSATEAKRAITGYGNRDVVFLLDATASMSNHMNKLSNYIYRIAEMVTKDGGRVALWVFGDLKDSDPYRMANFTSDIDLFKTRFHPNIVPRLGAGGDEPDSVYSATMKVLNTMQWRKGATKSIILLTDHEPLSPDRDGTTLQDVIKRSLEIDPVNVYTLGMEAEVANYYNNLVGGTDGEHCETLPDDLNNISITGRPNINLALEQYRAKPGETINYQIIGDTDNIDHIDWDLDLDGNYDTRSIGTMISAQYSTMISGFVKAKVSYLSGLESTVSAKVTVTDEPDSSPSVTIRDVLPDGDTAEISYALGRNTSGVIIRLNDILIGISSSGTLKLTDLSADSILTLIPFSADGTLGDPVQTEIALTGRGRAAQRDSSVTQKSPSQNSLTEKINQLLSNLIIRAPNTGKR